ncbi:hypothetical protein BGAL_0606g00040 [Botrytis galanthina]|uniref:Uncharacterized protein n=1 Tax=Botrytis galanthina TaxID=278940 RepID=A0A4S8QJ18_9HELO|nr:hypothetical protein BGAL_0606g00040 [Botrytis galanthina]
MITETAEFFVAKSSDWDILISQKQKKLLWMSKKKRDPEVEQGEFKRVRQERLENQSHLYVEREKMKGSSQLDSRHPSAAGRAWTVDDNRRAIMPASISEANGSGQGDL